MGVLRVEKDIDQALSRERKSHLTENRNEMRFSIQFLLILDGDSLNPFPQWFPLKGLIEGRYRLDEICRFTIHVEPGEKWSEMTEFLRRKPPS